MIKHYYTNSTDILSGKGCKILLLAAVFALTGAGYVFASGNSLPAVQDDKTILEGMVISSTDNKPLEGVTVYVEGTLSAVITGEDGSFRLEIPAKAEKVTFSAPGYDTKTLKVSDAYLFRLVTLIEIIDKLEDIVVVGFGTQKKESLVGAIESIKPAELDVTSSSLTTSFMGKIAGITGLQQSGEPGNDDVKFFIRGLSTFGSNTDPLIVLDGVEILPAMLNNLPPESIESFTILKDATSTSLYGSRGANGVIIINTKEGRDSEKMSFGLRFENTFSMPTRVQEIADGVTYMNAFNEAYYNVGEAPYYSQEKIEGTMKNLNPYVYPNNDWYEMLFKDLTANQTFNFHMTGGSKKIDYFMNATISNETGIIKEPKEARFDTNVSSRKFVFQSNVSSMITRTTRIGLKMNTQLWYNNTPYEGVGNLFYYAMRANPVKFPAVMPGEEGDTYTRYGNNTSWDVGPNDLNPYALLSRGYSKQFRSYLTSALSINQNLDFITKGLSAKGLVSFYNYSLSRTSGYFVPYYYRVDSWSVDPDGNYIINQALQGDPGNTYLQYSTGSGGHREWSTQASIDYGREFGKHDVAAMLVFHAKERVNNYYMTNSGSEKDLEHKVLPFRELGYAGRVTYNYDKRYFMELAFGYNGSENFARGHRFGFFPSMALGWTVSNERFFAPLRNAVDNLKLRASYGITGNDALPMRFPYVSTVLMGQGISFNKGSKFSGVSGPLIEKYGNPEATWEESRKLNIGIDIGLFNSFVLNVDYFTEDRSGIFMQRESLPSHLGVSGSAPYGNIGKVWNNGVELTATYTKGFTRDLSVSLRGTFTYAHNEVRFKDEPVGLEEYAKQVGHPISSIRGYVADGLFGTLAEIASSPTLASKDDTKPGDIKYVDLNNDGIIDSNDITTLGYPYIPEIVYGFGAMAKYKKWDFSFFFQGTARVSIIMYNMHPFAGESSFGYNMTQWIADSHWSEDNPDVNAMYPRLSPDWNVANTRTSSFWVRNGAYLRLKNLEIGYQPWPFFRVYLAGTNLFVLSPFDLWDPEMGSGNGLNYPLQRTIKLGLNFNF